MTKKIFLTSVRFSCGACNDRLILYYIILYYTHAKGKRWTNVYDDNRSMKIGDYEAQGEGQGKKTAKTIAAINMFAMIPEEWKNPTETTRKKKKRKTTSALSPTPAKKANVEKTNPKDSDSKQPEPRPIWNVVQTTNPISALFEYCKKGQRFYELGSPKADRL